jgi:hypothetical protein
MEPRLRAVCELDLYSARELVGLHDYDGTVQDLSPDGVRAALGRLGGPARTDAHDEAQLAAAEAAGRLLLGELEDHRRNPLHHIANLDLAGYDRRYAPAEERAAARRRHLASWPDAIEVATAALDRVPAPVADGLLGAAQGLTVGLDDADAGADDPVVARALDAHRHLVDHLAAAAREGDPDPTLGAAVLARVLGVPEALDVDLGRLSEQADAERDRLTALLTDAVRGMGFSGPLADAVAALQADHPAIDGVLEEAEAQTAEVLAWTAASGLLPEHDGECLVEPTPPSRSWAMAMMAPAAPFEPDGPSWYQVTPPDPTWPAVAQAEWLTVFSRTTLPAITVHEVAPGHFTHWRFLRRAPSDVRRAVHSTAFAEGWAHYAEELLLEEGFRAGDPRYAAGVAIEALIRVTRLAVSLGLHTGAMDLDEAIGRFTADAFLQGAAARSEAHRATFDPGYGCYTWGKLELLAARDRARRAWGAGYSHRRFHAALLDLGAPSLGLLDTAITHG